MKIKKLLAVVMALVLVILAGTSATLAADATEQSSYKEPKKLDFSLLNVPKSVTNTTSENISVISVTGGKIFFSQTKTLENNTFTTTSYYTRDIANGKTILIKVIDWQMFGISTPAILADRYIYFTLGIGKDSSDLKLQLYCVDVASGTMKMVKAVTSKQPYLQLYTIDTDNLALFDTGYSKDGFYYSKLDRLDVNSNNIKNIATNKMNEKTGEGDYLCAVTVNDEKIYTIVQKTTKSTFDRDEKDINGNISSFRMDCIEKSGKILSSTSLGDIQSFFMDPYTKGYYNMIFDFSVNGNIVLLSDNLLNSIVVNIGNNKITTLYTGARLSSSKFTKGTYLVDTQNGAQYILTGSGFEKADFWKTENISGVWDDKKGNTVLCVDTPNSVSGIVTNYYITSPT